MVQHYVYRFYAELKDYKPKVWRRFEINGEKTIAELGYALMLLFEMQASHLFCFNENRKEALLADLRKQYTEAEIKKVWAKHSMSEFAKNFRYELPNDDMYLDDDERLVEANKITLNRITDRPGWKLIFEYDYGDGWEVDVTLEDCEKRDVSLVNLPQVLDGVGYGIVEDVGGTGGLTELAKALKKGSGKKYDDFCAWLDSTTLDLEAFDIDDANFRVKKLLRVYKDIYEYHYAPTKKMLGILLREYQGKGSRGY
jgi:hypothetical protein